MKLINLLEQMENSKEVYHIMCDGEPVDTFDTPDEAKGHLDTYKKEHPGKQFIIEKGTYESHDHMIDTLDEMGEKLEQKDNNQNMKKPIVKSLAEAVLHARENGIKKFKINESIYDTDECWKSMEEEEGVDLGQEMSSSVDEDNECAECGDRNMEEDEFFNEEEEVPCTECGGTGLNEHGVQSYPDSSFNGLLDEVDDDTLDSCVCSRCNGEGKLYKSKDSSMDEENSFGDDINLEKGKKYNYKTPSFEDEIEFDDTANYEEGEPMFKFKGNKGDTHLLSKDHIKTHVHEDTCPKCGKEVCECGSMYESKKRTVRLTETQMKQFLAGIIKESGVPSITKKAQTLSKKENNQNITNVAHRMKDYLSFETNENDESVPEPIEKGKKNKNVVKFNNTEKEDEYVADNRGFGLQHLEYDHEPSEQFKQRIKDALEGTSKMGNSHDAANVIKTDTGKNIAKNAERKKKQIEDQPMYNKDVQPVKVVKENKASNVMLEEIDKMRRLSNYNQKTQ